MEGFHLRAFIEEVVRQECRVNNFRVLVATCIGSFVGSILGRLISGGLGQ